ncbi:MAG: hypothetical protein AAFQ94_30345 [Bacteroidota bacterium]
MASGAGFQMDAIKNLKDNRGLLRKTEAFDNIRKNNFINVPELSVEAPEIFYEDLKVIKKERNQKESKIKKTLVVITSTMVAVLIIAFLFLTRR